jgi:hypothetical protein
LSGAVEECGDQGAQKPRQPAHEEAEVVSGGGEDGVDAVAVASLEIVAAEAVLGLEMADDRLYCQSASLPPDRRAKIARRNTGLLLATGESQTAEDRNLVASVRSRRESRGEARSRPH